ncbi:sensor histidine kinase [Desulfurispira natronophila]|uniref:histidine kinase n=1 Tax=Desulfurispira natronophila TaxID=682562 RepID=A0A7W8DGB1_9BACT|nr:ATP-binding protein [Desulfurispira natronophila]MBB5021179.1 signal transduction histidine kinase [Desulfurispira natronophila]
MRETISTRRTLAYVAVAVVVLVASGGIAYWITDPCPFLLSSALVRLLAGFIAVAIYLRWRDWRILPLAIMFFLMALRQIFTLFSNAYGIDEPWLVQTLVEGPGFVVTFLAFFGVLYLWRVFANQARVQAAEAEAARRRRQIRQILDSQPSLVALANSHRVLNANRSLLEFLGHSSLESVGSSTQWLQELFQRGGALPQGLSWSEFLFQQRQADAEEVQLRLEKDGQPRVFLARFCPFVEAEEETIITFFDITALEAYQRELEQRHAEQRQMLVQQSRLAALGEMTGVIAHQWKQPLNTINWQVQMLQEQVAQLDDPRTAEASQSLQSILDQLDFMNSTITNFRDFFHPASQSQAFCPCQAISQVLQLLEVEFNKHHIYFELSCPDEPLQIWGRMNEFQQALLNLLVNSRDAIARRRREAIESQGIRAGKFDGIIGLHCQVVEGSLEMVVQDNGGGIPPEVLPQIFERFFTTRESEGGSGIGLYVARIIVEGHLRGSIQAENVRQGAQVRVSLPLFTLSGQE